MRRSRDGDLPVEKAGNAPDAARNFPGLDEPGVLGKLSAEQRDALLDKVREQHDQPPNPEGKNHWRVTGPFSGPLNVPGPLRISHVRNRVAHTYLEEGIMLLHVRERKTLKETAEQLGYSYRHIVDTWAAMKRRAIDEEGDYNRNGSVRDFVVEHLEKVIQVADGRMEENAAYGAVLIRACEALRALVGIDREDASSVDIAELAAAVRGRSPLLLEAIEHSEKGSWDDAG